MAERTEQTTDRPRPRERTARRAAAAAGDGGASAEPRRRCRQAAERPPSHRPSGASARRRRGGGRAHTPVDRPRAEHDAPARPRRADRARARAARRPVRDRRGARRRGRPAGRPRAAWSKAFVFACEHHADQRRQSGEDFIVHPVGVAKICAGMRLDTETLCAALLHDTVEDTSADLDEVRDGVRRGGRRPGRRRDQADRHHVPVARRGAGRELPQDDGRDGHGHPGHPDQARRPAAQHAHARRDAEAEADREGEGDARDLRAAGAPARHPRHQVGARGPLVRDAAPAQVPGDQGPGQPAARRARALRGEGGRLPDEGARGARHQGRDLRPREALLLDLLEDDQEGPRVQRDLRPHGDAGDRGVREGLLRRGRRDPLAVEAAARALQGHDRHAQVQHVPGPPHHGDRARGQAARDPDPHARHARDGRVRRRRALALQGGRAGQRRDRPDRRQAQVAQVAASTGRPTSRTRRSSPTRSRASSSTRRSSSSRRRARSSRSRPARRRSTSPTRSTPTSGTAASAPRSTARSCRCTTS